MIKNIKEKINVLAFCDENGRGVYARVIDIRPYSKNWGSKEVKPSFIRIIVEGVSKGDFLYLLNKQDGGIYYVININMVLRIHSDKEKLINGEDGHSCCGCNDVMNISYILNKREFLSCIESR